MYEGLNQRISSLINSAAKEIQEMVMSEVHKHTDVMPSEQFGVRDNETRESSVAQGQLTDVDIRAYATLVEKPGITLYHKDEFWTRDEIVILTAEGLFRFRFVMTESEGGSFIRRNGENFDRGALPDWDMREASSMLWLQYGGRALDYLARLRAISSSR